MADQHPRNTADALIAMCIDDTEFDLMLNKRVLRRSGAFETILQFTGGEEALAHMRTAPRRADVIFLDINMPVMNGFEFIQAATNEFGANFARSVVIMLTSSLNPKDRAMAEEFEAVREFLSKPLTVEDACDVAHRVRELIADYNEGI